MLGKGRTRVIGMGAPGRRRGAMFSSEKRASLASGLLSSEDRTPAEARGAEDPAPAASLFALPRGGARQRLIAATQQTRTTATPTAEPAPAAIAPVEAAAEPHQNSPATVLYSKGDASASGFRPWYWSYERDASSAPPADKTPLDQAPSRAPGPAEAVAPPHAAAAPAAPRARGGAKLTLLLGAGAAVLALGGAALLLMPQHSTPPVSLALPLPALPMAPPVPPPPRPAPVAALPATLPAAPPAPAARHVAVPAAEFKELMARGDQMLATGDIAAARLFYQRAAEGGDAAAARQTGKTYDPLFLAEAQARGLRGDPVAAARWYRKASAGGDREADALMRRLMAKYAR